MGEIDIRGGCDGMPLELTGEFTGYNNGATMQIGLWIRNDAEYIDQATYVAQQYGVERLAGRLLHILANNWHSRPGSAAAAAYDGFQDGTYDEGSIDWAQIAYDLIGAEPDDDEIDAARRAGARQGLVLTDTGAWETALRERQNRTARWVLEGVR